MDSTTRHWRFLRERPFRHRRDLLLVLHRGARQGRADHRDPGVPAPPLPPRLRVRQHQQGHQEADGPDRQEDRHQVVPGRPRSTGCAASSNTNTACRTNRSSGSPSSTRTSTSRRRPDLKITRLPHDKSVEDMLAEGELDALIHSDIIKPMEAGDPRVGRLWPDYKAEEIRFYKKTQHFPDHARDGHPAGDRRPPPVGAGQPVPRLREVQGDRACSGWTTRASCRSPGIARPGTSSRRFSGPIRGSMG